MEQRIEMISNESDFDTFCTDLVKTKRGRITNFLKKEYSGFTVFYEVYLEHIISWENYLNDRDRWKRAEVMRMKFSMYNSNSNMEPKDAVERNMKKEAIDAIDSLRTEAAIEMDIVEKKRHKLNSDNLDISIGNVSMGNIYYMNRAESCFEKVLSIESI